jgi:hypothetical protein
MELEADLQASSCMRNALLEAYLDDLGTSDEKIRGVLQVDQSSSHHTELASNSYQDNSQP